MRVVAVVLAAGEGRRIGGPKALLPLGGETFLTRTCRILARPAVETVLAVVGHQAERIRTAGGLPPSVAVVENPGYSSGMLGSVLRGLAAAEARGAEAVLLHPVDHPLVAPATVDRVVAALEAGAPIAVPSFEGRRGHPGGFAAAAWPALRAAPADRGARAVLAEHPEWVVHVPGDRGCVAGVDTPADYERWIGPWETGP
jgi:CTP:molybdopterin cytidylyltransferase MocA